MISESQRFQMESWMSLYLGVRNGHPIYIFELSRGYHFAMALYKIQGSTINYEKIDQPLVNDGQQSRKNNLSMCLRCLSILGIKHEINSQKLFNCDEFQIFKLYKVIRQLCQNQQKILFESRRFNQEINSKLISRNKMSPSQYSLLSQFQKKQRIRHQNRIARDKYNSKNKR